jgi:hypothetical protein
MLIALLVTGTCTFLLLGLAVIHWVSARNVEGVAQEIMDELDQAPIRISERTLAAEVERGLKDLQAFLLDAA